MYVIIICNTWIIDYLRESIQDLRRQSLTYNTIISILIPEHMSTPLLLFTYISCIRVVHVVNYIFSLFQFCVVMSATIST
jgi:hypothetical protein